MIRGCRHREVEMYGPPPGPVGSGSVYRQRLRRWRCVECKGWVTDQHAGKIIRKAARKPREVTR